MSRPSPSRRQLIARWAIFIAILGLLWLARRNESPPADQARTHPAARTIPPVVEPGWTPPPRSPVAAHDAQRPAPPDETRVPGAPADERVKAPPERPQGAPRGGEGLVLEGLTLRDAEGGTIYRGRVDLAPTLERIAAGKRLRFSNDGATFQNRERRLPGRPSGYYREWVVPTPGESGPGPQRLVTGEDGEVWYTSDHYRSFRRIPTKALSR